MNKSLIINTMTKEKKLGIWMDHSSVHLIEFPDGPMEKMNIESDFTHQDREQTLSRSEKTMHNKERHQQMEYYKKVGAVIENYNDIILFGPTDAKVELFNILRADRRFEKIKIDVMQTDKMTVNQQHAFVRAHFSGI